MGCRCRGSKGLKVPATVTATTTVKAEDERRYGLVASGGKLVGRYATELEAKAARVRNGGGTVQKL